MSTVPCSNTNMTMWYEFITLQWRHVSVMVSQVMVNSTALSTGCWGPTEKHQRSALYALMDPPVTRLVCCHTILQFKSHTEKFDFKWRHIWSNSLKHWGLAKMADIFQTTFLKALYWMKMYKFRLRFHGSLFLGVPAGDKPLSEPMMICLLTHICVTRPQWVKDCDVLQLLSAIQT